MNLDTSKLEVGKVYTYSQLCELLGVAEKKGGARKSQIEKWWDWFEWEKVNAQKYKITLIRETPLERIDGRVNNGGARAGAGRKRLMENEFEFLLRSFLEYKYNQNLQLTVEPIRFTRNEIGKYFGVVPADLYERLEGEKSADEAAEVVSKMSEKLTNLVLKKIAGIEGVESLGYGCLGYTPESKDGIPCDGLLELWDKYSSEYAKKHASGSLGLVAQRGKWREMEEYIAKRVGGFSRIARLYKVCINRDALPEKIDLDEWAARMLECRRAFNDYVVESVKESFEKRRGKKFVEQEGVILTPEELAEWEEILGPLLPPEEEEDIPISKESLESARERFWREKKKQRYAGEYVDEAIRLTEKLLRIKTEDLAVL